jgi:kynureninase
MIEIDQLAHHPHPLARHYRRFRVTERILLSGHSHQAWPDCGFEAQQQAWLDAAEHVDEKWELAFEQARRVREGWARLLGDAPERISLAANTHELLVRWLSALPLAQRPRLLTTDGEFHSIRRQLDRLAEEGLEVLRIAAEPVDTLAERLSQEVDDRTAAVLVSSVLYRSARIVPRLGVVMDACRRHGAELLVDAYHQLNVVPCDIHAAGLSDAYFTGAGYKYAQLGEGVGFLRFPEGCRMRPVITGWFAEFEALTRGERPTRVPYDDGPLRFAGATYDPASHYRAAAVFTFFQEQGLEAGVLRAISQHQIALLISAFDALDLDPALARRDTGVTLEDLGGFLVIHAPRAGDLRARLRDRGVFSDHRGEILRLGPAPYLSDGQLQDAMLTLGECARELRD